MTDQQRNDSPEGKPSQAEGERPEDLSEQERDPTEPPAGHPSQAEGSREEVEEDLRRRR